MAHKVGTGIITGVVSEDGVAKANAMVCVYDRDTNQLVYRGKCGPTGEYTFSGLNHNTDSYYVMVQDDDGAIKKNALIQDYVQPVNGAVGSQFDANWYIAFKELNPLYLAAGVELNSKQQLAALNISASSEGVAAGGYLTSGAMVLSAQSTLLGALGLNKVDVSAGFLLADCASQHYGWSQQHYPVSGGFTIENSLFICADTAKPFSMANRSNGSNGYVYSYLTLSSAFVISCVVGISSANQQQVLMSYTIPAGAGRSGLHSICYTLDSSVGGVSKLYFDGVEVASYTAVSDIKPHPTANPISTGYDGGMFGGLALGGYYLSSVGESVFPAGTFTFTVAAIYQKQLTLSEVQSLHDSLYVASAPKLTGYRKEVALDFPQMFYPLCTKEQGGRTGDMFVPYARNRKFPVADNRLLTYFEEPVLGEQTPVNGMYGTRFNKNGMYEVDSQSRNNFINPIGLGPWFYSVELWLKLEATPTEKEYILSSRTRGNDAMLSSIWVTTSRTLEVYSASASNDTVSFTPVLNVGDWYHVVVTMDRATGNALLYLNGTLADTKATGLTALTLAYVLNYGGQGSLSIGGDRPTVLSKSNLINASMMGLAIYNRILSAARIQAHYDSRLIA